MYGEKRRIIKTGDAITFINTQTKVTCVVDVTNLHIYKDFKTCYYITTILHPKYETIKLDIFTEQSQKEFKEQIEDNDILDDLYKKLNEMNTKLYEDGQSDLNDIYSYTNPNINLSDYGFKENIIGFISIERMNIKLPIYLGASKENMKVGATHLTYSSFPIGGKNTNAVIAAHRGSTTPMFKNIHTLQIGDEIIIENFKETLVYKVESTKIITPNEIDQILIRPEKDMITLLSCNPLGKNYQRYLVYCERIH